MKKGIQNWVIDVASPSQTRILPRKTETVEEPVVSLAADFFGSMTGNFISETLESVLNSGHDPLVELAKVGAVIRNSQLTTNNLRKIINNRQRLRINKQPTYNKKQRTENKDEDFGDVISQIQTPIRLTAHNLQQPTNEDWQTGSGGYIKSERIVSSPSLDIPRVSIFKNLKFNFLKSKNYWKLPIFILGILGFTIYGFGLKGEITRNGELAISNIKMAQASLEKFNFSNAADNFKKSHNNFNQAGRNLNFIGAGILGNIPWFGELKSARNIMEAGKLFTSSGKSLSEALALLSRVGSVLDLNETEKVKPSKIINQLKIALELSSSNFDKAKALLSDINDNAIPEDRRKDFIDFKEKLPILEKTLDDAYKYTGFLENVIGIDKHKKYLILFNNYSELRPTGGFPGTYGIISFSNGGLENFFVNDVYNLDGQLKRKIIPPKQLQHITPTWAMRDVAWFIDFPTSAKKVVEFFEEESGYGVNGVIALNPDIISHILKVVGPIEMPEYNMTITADNFLASVQEEVEYGDNRAQPKTIIVDLAPRLLDKLYSADSGQWMEIFSELVTSLEEKDTMFYFEDKELESFAIEENFGGEIKQTDADYLTVNLSNIKGSKTDIVTDSFINIEIRQDNDHIIHKVAITRKHKGGDHELDFYNRQNPSYIRVLIPSNAELLNVSGNDLPRYYPLVDYQNSIFEKDSDLAEFESGFYFDETMGVDRFEEGNKNGVGFWVVTDPGKVKTVILEYSTPINTNQNSFYFQKQPGLDWKNFKFKWNGQYLINTEIAKDLDIPLNP
ncbi:MAG: hypothetical protein A2816_01330 [Candidatus Yanofskybacteria bacterium RIFCSPHIGHO2_01_FULL_39_44]|nr:MAG: hypothetical protein A2816_01330 [Candidatus Yanofskybacteria bacterium RIFCSPHIGHO2_01_FULL_39_44]